MKRIGILTITVLMMFAVSALLMSYAEDSTESSVITVSFPDYACGIVDKADSALVYENTVVDGRNVMKIVPNPTCTNASNLILEGWSIASAKIDATKYHWVVMSYRYESAKPCATPMCFRYLSSKTVLTSSVMSNSSENISEGLWTVAVFDMTEVAEKLHPDSTDHTLRQIHIFPFGQTPIGELSSDDALYIESLSFYCEKPNIAAHYSYMKGYSDNTFKPGNAMTRAEACAVVSRVIEDEVSITGKPTFSDVDADAWYAKYIGFCEEKGYLSSFSGTFEPNKKITRAEFAELVYNTKLSQDGEKSIFFSDVGYTHPRYTAITAAAAAGLIQGYPDGTFAPDSTVTRAQVVTVINRALGREIETDGISATLSDLFADVSEKTYWAYAAIAEATVPHIEENGKWLYTMNNVNEISRFSEGEKKLAEVEALSAERKKAILSAKSDCTEITGKIYYVSQSGNDENDGLSPEKAWKSLAKVTEAELLSGDGVLFERGNLWRGSFVAKDGVVYSAYGEGEKPSIYGSPENGADASKWTLWKEVKESGAKIWKYENEKLLDVGTLFFNENPEMYAYKVMPFLKDGKLYGKSGSEDEFDISTALERNLEFVHFSLGDYTETGITPNPKTASGPLYLRCDSGNPGELFDSIEFNVYGNIIQVWDTDNVVIDNLCVKYTGSHGVSGMRVNNLTVRNCEFSDIGGSIMTFKNDRTIHSRYGNGVQVWGDCNGYYVKDNYISNCYDAGITHQQGSGEKRDIVEDNVSYTGNLIENCVYGIEYFMCKSAENPSAKRSCTNVLIENNVITHAGYGFGSTRHNGRVQACIKGWDHENEAHGFLIKNNIFALSVWNLLHLAAAEDEWLPVYDGNTYIQGNGNNLVKVGSPKSVQQINNEDAQATVTDILGDKTGKVYTVGYIPYYEFVCGND